MGSKKNNTVKDKKDGGKSVRTRTRTKASPSKADSSPLKRSFASTVGNSSSSSNSKKDGESGVQVSKAQQSSFVTYMRCCTTGKDSKAANQAEVMLADYRQMSAENKKNLIHSFFASGGRKAGLQSIYEQNLSLQQKSDAKSWTGYATATRIMTLHDVLLLVGVGELLMSTTEHLFLSQTNNLGWEGLPWQCLKVVHFIKEWSIEDMGVW